MDKSDVFATIMYIIIRVGLFLTILIHWVINLPLALIFKIFINKKDRPSFKETILALNEVARDIWK